MKKTSEKSGFNAITYFKLVRQINVLMPIEKPFNPIGLDFYRFRIAIIDTNQLISPANLSPK